MAITPSTVDSDQTVISPATIFLVARSIVKLKTGMITFFHLNLSDEILFVQAFGCNTHFFCFGLHIRHLHG
jgi:hypothetical protein